MYKFLVISPYALKLFEVITLLISSTDTYKKPLNMVKCLEVF